MKICKDCVNFFPIHANGNQEKANCAGRYAKKAQAMLTVTQLVIVQQSVNMDG